MNRKFITRALYILSLFVLVDYIGNYGIYQMLQAITDGLPRFFSYENSMFVSLGITETKLMATILSTILYLSAFAALVLASLIFTLAWNAGTLGRRKAEALPKKKAGWLGVLIAVVLFAAMFGLFYVAFRPELLCAELLLMVLYWEYAWGGRIAERTPAAAAVEPVPAELPEELRLFPEESADTTVFARISDDDTVQADEDTATDGKTDEPENK